jgi:hypothetical protein
MRVNREAAERGVRIVGQLSAISGALLIAIPLPMGRLYALPQRASLLRLVGARDVVVGALALGGWSRAALALRAGSDLLDAGLIVRAARESERPLGEVKGRLFVAFASATLALLLRRAVD